VTSPDEGEACFDVEADHVVIEGFELTGPPLTAGIRFEGSHNVFAENTIQDLSGTDVSAVVCMDADGGSNHNKIVNNTITGSWKGIVIQAGSDDAPDAVNKGSVIRGNIISEVVETPVLVENGIGFVVAGNQITGVASGEGHCIQIGAGEGNTETQGRHRVWRNELVDCGLNGIDVYTSDAPIQNNRIAGNDISAAGGCGIHLAGQPEAPVRWTWIRGNHVHENGEGGICLGAETIHNRVFGNCASDNGGDGMLVAGDQNGIRRNRAWGNGGNGILVEGNHNGIFWNRAFENDGRDLKDKGTDNRWWRNRHGTDNW
jgi:parallel beta-helix repeat protein